ncbi:MAG: transposase-like protein [Hydrogenophaga sp.]
MPQTLNEWAERDEINTGVRVGTTTTELQRLKEFEGENKELRKANEILKRASAFLSKLRVQRDDTLAPHIERVWQDNMRVYGADKVWKQMNLNLAVTP